MNKLQKIIDYYNDRQDEWKIKEDEFQSIKHDSHIEAWRNAQEKLKKEKEKEFQTAKDLEARETQAAIDRGALSKDNEIAFVRAKYLEKKELLEKHQLDTKNLTIAYYKELDDIARKHKEREQNMMLARVSATSQMFSAISSLIKASAKDSKKAAILQKTLSIFSITADTAVAIMKAYRTSDPYIASAKAITIGAVGAAQIAMVASTPTHKHGRQGEPTKAATGISGGSQVGDKNHVRINGDEQITNRRQQANQMSAYGISGGVTAANQRKLFDLIDSGSQPAQKNVNYSFNIGFQGSPSSVTQAEIDRSKEIVLELVQNGEIQDIFK